MRCPGLSPAHERECFRVIGRSQVQNLNWTPVLRRSSFVGMRGYGQFCPIAKAAEILAERWTFLVLRELILGSTRFNDLRRGVPLMSSSLLSQRLKFLEHEGVIERLAAGSGQGFEYRLTVAGGGARAPDHAARRVGRALGAQPADRRGSRRWVPDVGHAPYGAARALRGAARGGRLRVLRSTPEQASLVADQRG